MVSEAEATDASEDALFGDERGDELPADRRGRAPNGTGNGSNAEPAGLELGDPIPFDGLKMRVA